MLINQNIKVDDRRTSIRLEPEFWAALAAIAQREGQTIDQVCTEVDQAAGKLSRTAAIRVFITTYMLRLSELASEQFLVAMPALASGRSKVGSADAIIFQSRNI